MRLIDADNFRRFAHEQLEGNKTYSIDEILEMIDEQPTAYDMDKVVAELEEWSFEAEIVISGSDGYDDTVNREIICTKNAIDIVKRGGVE